MTGGPGGMKTDEPKSSLGEPRKEGQAEERMEDWFHEGASSEFEEGEVVRGRVVQVTATEVLVDVGYKSEGAIPIDEFHRHGKLPRVGDEIEVYLEAKEDSEGLIVLSKDKADKIKVWDAITQAHEKGLPVEGRVVEVVKGGLAVDVGVKAFLPGSQVDLRPVKNLAGMVGQSILWPVLGTPIQCEMPPVAISAMRSWAGRPSMKRRTKLPSAHERFGVGSGGATQLVSTGTIGSEPSGIRKCAGTETSSQNSRSWLTARSKPASRPVASSDLAQSEAPGTWRSGILRKPAAPRGAQCLSPTPTQYAGRLS